MVGQTLGHYRIVEKIGAGGMGVVYRAHDEQLDRDVALKVLPAGTLGDEAVRKRFRVEALALAKLNHPNVETVFEFGTHDGVDFLAMEYITGVSLDEKLLQGAVPEKESVRLGSQLAQGLAAAHEQGIVHRDLKPGNLRLTSDGRLKILDFGLAKWFRPVEEADATRSLDQTQGITGTLPYMAPEQLQGAKVDARTDIYAAGAVLYEMATGQRPFREELAPRLTDAILHQAPVPPRAVKGNISPDFERIILKCLDKEPDNRYQSARELEVDLRRLASPSSAVTVLTAKPAKMPWQRMAIGVGIAALFVAALVALKVSGWRERLQGGGPEGRIQSLAVLPLENLSRDPEQDYFADGMTETLITDLAKISALRVISRTSVMQYKGARKPLPEIARELNVDAVVEGSVQRSGNRVRITAQLIRGRSDQHLWAETYERDLRDVLTLQDEVAQAIANEVRVKVTPQEHARLATPRPINPEAHEAYLKGRYYLSKGTEKNINTGIEYFQHALKIDPGYALAYAGLADSYGALTDVYLPPSETMPEAKAAAMKAIELDETLAGAHTSLGAIRFFYDWDWPAGEKELRRALELNPNFADAHDLNAGYMTAMGRFAEAAPEIRRAQELDPLSLFIQTSAQWMLFAARQYDRSIEQGQRSLELNASFGLAHSFLGLAYAGKGQFAQAIAEARKGRQLDDSPMIEASLGCVYASSGKRDEARKVLSDLEEMTKRRYVCPYEVGATYLQLGEKDEAFKWFEKAYRERSVCCVWFKVDPRLDSVRSDPRYNNLLRRIGFPL